MKKIASAAATTAMSILISSSVALGHDPARSTGSSRHPWAKVVVNHPTPKLGAYYKGVSPIQMAATLVKVVPPYVELKRPEKEPRR
ncbi:hypothetical protein EV130_11419 [Rhizobium azibense]|uniref:Uncharacterized protein n=1 Tax=Rhizobium azibense TaxID=1136135 RepID=A0A4R3QG67_9HYPH|nr:hypothetical protein EV130_11419 [Rhizobium azibense]